MASIGVETTLTGTIEEPQIKFEGRKIPLTRTGDGTWTFVGTIDVNDKVLNIEFTAKGIATSKWAIKVNQLKPEEKELFDLKGTIDSNGIEFFTAARKIF